MKTGSLPIPLPYKGVKQIFPLSLVVPVLIVTNIKSTNCITHRLEWSAASSSTLNDIIHRGPTIFLFICICSHLQVKPSKRPGKVKDKASNPEPDQIIILIQKATSSYLVACPFNPSVHLSRCIFEFPKTNTPPMHPRICTPTFRPESPIMLFVYISQHQSVNPTIPVHHLLPQYRTPPWSPTPSRAQPTLRDRNNGSPFLP